jgi:hypothetical protein
MALFSAVGYLAARLGVEAALSEAGGGRAAPGGILLHVGLVGVATWLALLAHEAGHALGGVSRGFRFLFVAAGPLWLERRGDQLGLRLNTSLSTWGGVAACVPEDDRDLPRRFAVMVVGGPIASLALAAAGAATWALLLPGHTRFALGAVAVASLALFVATAQPFGAGGGFASDGGRLLTILRGGVRGAREAAMLALTAAAAGGVRPREWRPALLADASRPADGSTFEVAALVFAGQAAADRGDLERAWGDLERAVELADGLSPVLRAVVAAEAAWAAATRGDAVRARALVARADGPFTERHALRRAEAAVLLAEGDRIGAARAAAAGLAELPRARFGRPSARERELLEALAAPA